MNGQQIGYIRVSTIDQNTDRQLHGIELDRVYEDKCSGKDANRPKLTKRPQSFPSPRTQNNFLRERNIF